MIKGLQLSEMFYLYHGKSMIKKQFPELESRIAIGLVGEGSECFGFDDEISKDHDYGPSFCLWLSDDDYNKYHDSLKKGFESLPALFGGMKTKLTPFETCGRTGVLNINHFYQNILEIDKFPTSNIDWMKIKEINLATAVNGKIFRDDLGIFSSKRDILLNYYPHDVWLKRLAASLALIAQSGQYNYIRCVRRGSLEAAFLMITHFVQNCIKAIFLLNRRYRPFDKWTFKSMETLPELKSVQTKLKKLILDSCSEYEKISIIEAICSDIIAKLVSEKLSLSDDNFLMTHAIEITKQITDDDLLKLNVLSDEI